VHNTRSIKVQAQCNHYHLQIQDSKYYISTEGHFNLVPVPKKAILWQMHHMPCCIIGTNTNNLGFNKIPLNFLITYKNWKSCLLVVQIHAWRPTDYYGCLPTDFIRSSDMQLPTSSIFVSVWLLCSASCKKCPPFHPRLFHLISGHKESA
jgi:hypothetical protein